MIIGGARRDRTADLNTASVALSQLSYGPLERARTLIKRLCTVKRRESYFFAVMRVFFEAAKSRLCTRKLSLYFCHQFALFTVNEIGTNGDFHSPVGTGQRKTGIFSEFHNPFMVSPVKKQFIIRC